MPNIRNRIEKLEETRPAEPVKPALAFTWHGEQDDAALVEIKARAEAVGRMLIIRRIIDPPPRKTTV